MNVIKILIKITDYVWHKVQIVYVLSVAGIDQEIYVFFCISISVCFVVHSHSIPRALLFPFLYMQYCPVMKQATFW
jgi:hypothetical protein